MQSKTKFRQTLVLVLFVLTFAVSCVPVKELSYFNDINDIQEPAVNPRTQKLIMPFDKLYINVLSIDPQTSQIFNSVDEMRYNTNADNGIIGYLVDEKGTINFPFVGKIVVGNMTTHRHQ